MRKLKKIITFLISTDPKYPSREINTGLSANETMLDTSTCNTEFWFVDCEVYHARGGVLCY